MNNARSLALLNRRIKSNFNIDFLQRYTYEIAACRQNPLYFIFNYVYISEVGGYFKYTPEKMHPKFKRVVRSIFRYKKCILMATRQLGKSTLAACLLAWAACFYPKIQIGIINYSKDVAQDNLRKVRDIIEHLPDWMKTTLRCYIPKLGLHKTYFEMKNGSAVRLFYPSTIRDPNTIARSFSFPILYLDEVAFIPHIDDIWGSAQPTMNNAIKQAAKNKYPYFVLMTSTPNGTVGDGKFFYEFWLNAINSDELFVYDDKYDDERWIDNVDDVINAYEKSNGFIKVKFHWSEDPTKDEEWYIQQCKNLNWDQRKINQELDLKFIGPSSALFDDDTISALTPVRPVTRKTFKHGTLLKLFKEPEKLSKGDYYLIGVDTASSVSTNAAFNAIEIFTYSNFEQVGEMVNRLGHLLKYGEVIDDIFRWFAPLVDYRVILCIENNGIGQAIIEYLTYSVNDFDYIPFIFKEPDQKNTTTERLGIRTNKKSKELMITNLFELVTENPKRIKSEVLIEQLSSIQRTSSGTIAKGVFTDAFMSASFCAYVRKRMERFIMPLITVPVEEYERDTSKFLKSVASVTSPNDFIKHKKRNHLRIVTDEDVEELQKTQQDMFMQNILNAIHSSVDTVTPKTTHTGLDIFGNPENDDFNPFGPLF